MIVESKQIQVYGFDLTGLWFQLFEMIIPNSSTSKSPKRIQCNDDMVYHVYEMVL